MEEDYQVKDVVYAQLNRQYREYRHNLHAHYLKRKGEGEILDQSLDGVTREDWKLLIDYFESDNFMVLCFLYFLVDFVHLFIVGFHVVSVNPHI